MPIFVTRDKTSQFIEGYEFKMGVYATEDPDAIDILRRKPMVEEVVEKPIEEPKPKPKK